MKDGTAGFAANRVLGQWILLSLFTDFFEDPGLYFQKLEKFPFLQEVFGAVPKDTGEEKAEILQTLPEWGRTLVPKENLPLSFRVLYDDLLKGTAADIDIRPFASVCTDQNGSLFDGTTLEILRIYHRFGYEPVEMDGNPPDYLGQMFRFLCYLIAASSHERLSAAEKEAENTVEKAAQKSVEKTAQNTKNATLPDLPGLVCLESEYALASRDLISDFVLDTARATAEGFRKYTGQSNILRLCDLMIKYLEQDGDEICGKLALGFPKEDAAAAGSILRCLETGMAGRGAPIPEEASQFIRTSCRNNCGGRCALMAESCEGCLLNISTGDGFGSPELHACLRGRSYRKTYMNPSRLRYPMIRRDIRGNGKFLRVSWEQAEELTASELERLTSQYGPGCRLVNYGSGIQSLMRPSRMAQRFLALTGGYLAIYGSYSSINTEVATSYVYGDIFSGNSPESLLDTKYLILWANNPISTIFGSQLRQILTEVKAKGTKIVVIDPRISDTAVALADEWIGIRPSTDGALADAMAWTIWSEGLQDQHFMDTYCLGFDAEHMPEGVPRELNYHDYLFGILDGIPKTPAWAAPITGIPAETIRRIAIEYATAKPACLFPGLGNQRTGNGEQTSRGMAALACLTGNVGIWGGGAAGCGMALEEAMPSFPIGDNPYKGVISCFIWTAAIEHGKEMTMKKDHIRGMEQLSSDVKFIFNLAGNTLLNQHSDVNDTIRILQDDRKCEFILASDVFMTPSTRFADLLLPATSFLEENDVNMPWRYGHYILAARRIIRPFFGCRSEYGFIAGLARRFGVFEEWSDGFPDRESHMKYLFEHFPGRSPELPELESFLEAGGHVYQHQRSYVAYEEQIRDPEHHPFSTPTGKIEIVSQRLYAMGIPEIPAHCGYVPCKEGPADVELKKRYPLQLIGFHTKRRCHSIHDNNVLLEEADPQVLWIHKKDADARGIQNGDVVYIWNDRGRIRIRAKVTDRLVEGTAALSQGAWYTPDSGAAVGSGSDDIRGNINTLTAFAPTPLAKGNPQHTNLVEVALAEHENPECTQ